MIMDIKTILSTEMRLLEPICAFTDKGDYSIYKSEKFPTYYGGNGVDIHTPGDRSLKEWEDIFHEHFDPARYEHTTFTFPKEEEYDRLMSEAALARYNVEVTSYMFVDATDHCHALPEEWEIHTIATEEDWQRFGEFSFEDAADYDWYDPNASGNSLFDKTRFTSEVVGIEWFYITRRGEKEMLSSLGIFKHNGICRLQDVRTGRRHRRQGLATYLVSFAIDRAINTFGAAGLALCADRDYYAIDLYRKLGFVEKGDAVCLMKYPPKNPAHMEGN